MVLLQIILSQTFEKNEILTPNALHVPYHTFVR